MAWCLVLGAVAALSMASGLKLDGFRVKHAWSGALKDKDNFYTIPRNLRDADAMGLRLTPHEQEHGLDVTMRCLEDDPRVCPLYDRAGYIAGLQIAIPAKHLDGIPYDISTKMKMRTILGNDYWTTTHYVTSPETIRAGGRKGPITDTADSIWVQNGNDLMQIPMLETDLATKTLFKKQNCIPNMGTHYYYNMSSELSCQDIFPYFALVKEGRVLGLGWQIIGKTEKTGRHWFEHPPSRAVEMTIPSAPACLQDWSNIYGVISLHMYYIEEPWEIKCEDGDSLQPMSVVNKFLLNTSRYGSKVADEVKKIFSG